MNNHKNKKIYIKCRSKKIKISHAAEVGVYLPETSNIIDFIEEGKKTTLVEADPKSIQAIKKYFHKNNNITIYPVAVYDYDGEIELAQCNASTFVSILPNSPALINDNYKVQDKDKFTVKCSKFSGIDDGTIDLISIDIEGSEWYVLKHIISRPKIISIETHGKCYTNPYIKEILNWMEENSYEIWYKDRSDTVFTKKDMFEMEISEKIHLKIMDMYINFRKWEKTLMGNMRKT